MFFTDLFNLTHVCKHHHFSPDQELGYCPDCGKLIKNEWYITRCACCGVKLRSIIKNNNVLPAHRFCMNCGSEEFNVEKLHSINFIDINFAVLVKTAVEDEGIKSCTTTSCWQEKTTLPPKLLVQYL